MKFYFDLMNLCRPNAASSISKTTDEGTKKNVVISQLFKGLTLVLTCILKCTFNANFQIHLYRMCWFFFFNFASVIFFHLWFYIQRTKFILGESVSIVMNFILKILQTRILRNQSVFVVIHFICGKTCNNIILKHYLRVML